MTDDESIARHREEVVQGLVDLGMPKDSAAAFAGALQEQMSKQLAELEKMIRDLLSAGERLLEQRDALRLHLKEALDWLASFDHEAALKIRRAAEAV